MPISLSDIASAAEPSIEADNLPISNSFTVKAEPKDVGGKVRSWGVIAPSGTKLGCVTTRRGATKIADLLTRFVGSEQAI